MSTRRIMVLGATGKTGTQIVRQALESGHDVAALVRDPARLAINDPKLKVVTGDVLDAASVERGLAGGYDAVISALGVFHSGAPHRALPRHRQCDPRHAAAWHPAAGGGFLPGGR